MMGKPECGVIMNRDEVVCSSNQEQPMYKGILSIAGKGRWETPETNSKSIAQTLLDGLRAKHMPVSETQDGISAAQAAVFAAALDGQVRPRRGCFIPELASPFKPQAEVVRGYAAASSLPLNA